MDSTSWEENVTFSVSGFEEITTIYFEEVNVSSTVSPEVTPTVGYSLELDVSFQIGLYVLIFLLAVLGNVLVLVTLAQNRGMRTITNLFLLNLAIADLLVGVLCMPFSLTGTILKDFIFGHALCKLIPYLQALSVSVSAWTLVAISVERYYAICHPLTSRKWQTISHAYRMIGLIWILSGISMIPIPLINTLQPIRDTGRHKCREVWPNQNLERAYTIFLDIALLILPLGIMAVNYSLITVTLWQVSSSNPDRSLRNPDTGDERTAPVTSRVSPNPRITITHSQSNGGSSFSPNSNSSQTRNDRNHLQVVKNCRNSNLNSIPRMGRSETRNNGQNSLLQLRQPGILRQSNVGKSLMRKKRVIQMLSVVVLEFFVCWTPLYVMNTWYLFNPSELYDLIGPIGVSLIQLLAYVSSCVNPITYCFMNRGFRSAFCSVFGCRGNEQLQRNVSLSHRTESLRLTSRKRSAYKLSDQV